MITFSDVWRDIEKRLDRKLQDCEIEFLHWVLERHKEEQRGKSEHAAN